MDVCVRLFCVCFVLFVGSGPRIPTVCLKKVYVTEEEARAQQRTVEGRDIAQAVSRWLPTVAGSRTGLVKWDLWWTKWRWGRFSPSPSVSPANLHSTNYSKITLIYHLGLYKRPEVSAVPGDVSPTPLKKIGV
jgi:hypothetical protein